MATEKSSPVVAFRALVMIICLALVPVAAFCGTSYPNVVKAIQEGRWPTLADFRAAKTPATAPTSEAPLFNKNGTPSAAVYAGNARQGSPACGPSATPYSQPNPVSSQVMTASYEAPDGPRLSVAQSLSNSVRNPGPDPQAPQRLFPVPSGAQDLIPLQRNGSREPLGPAADVPNNRAAPPQGDLFRSVQDRLQQMGATYYLLETWGDEKREFRFYCRMAIAGNPRVTKTFWCVDNDPLKAMTQVLQQVESWKSGGG